MNLNPKNILITGGAGYIGSHMVNIMVSEGFNVVVLDDLSGGHKDAVHKNAKLIIGDIADEALVLEIITENKIDAIMHFAAFIEVEESVRNPQKYFNNNYEKPKALVSAALKGGVNYFILSSTAAIFGDVKYLPVDESHSKNPINSYGESKLMFENFLAEISSKNKDFRHVCLRYFNAAGADYENNLGPRHKKMTHLIPLLISFEIGLRKEFIIFGNDYNTKDGTCVRDYVHVLDICDAHLKALKYLTKFNEEHYFNLGSAVGFSVLDVVLELEKIIGKKVDFKLADRRVGDPATIVADNIKAKEILGWNPQFSSLENIISSALKWERQKLKSIN